MTASVTSADVKPEGRKRHRIIFRGAVQGVGFRPFVCRRATALGLAGWVANSTEGVTMEAEGDATQIMELLDAIRQSPPVNARITEVSVREITPRGEADFSIRKSKTSGVHRAQLLPDLATCDECLTELFDPLDRRYRYPFINCTRCGPRYSIIENIPYDRIRTSMRRFEMCDRCQAEYDDLVDRRFHAEPNACPDCGPQLALWDAAGAVLAHADDALLAAVAAVREGGIVAVKGIGGFHLFADARDERVARELRLRKHREGKPFAVMFPSLADVRKSCRLDAKAEALLTGTARPIVLVARQGELIAPSVASHSPRLGVLLPYAPLHHLLMRELGFPVIATSGNVSDEPIVTDEGEVLRQLAGIADLFLIHDRPIVQPLDDSVVQVVCSAPQLLRRARGYAPMPVSPGDWGGGIMAFGGHLKAAVALSSGAGVVMSQHIGDLETTTARRRFRQTLAGLHRLHPVSLRLAVRDLHPDYASSRAAEVSGLPVVAVQHHLAHVASCLAEHDLSPPALGIAWDGTGYGTDGTIWGGEFLHVTDTGWRRVARLRPFRLPGGDAASREPRRSALGLLYAAYGADAFAMGDLPPVAAFAPSELAILRTMLEQAVNAPITSSMGRLFDAFASLLGLRQRALYEGQAATELEWSIGEPSRDEGAPQPGYVFPARDAAGEKCPLTVDWQPALEATLADLKVGTEASRVSEALHKGLAGAIVEIATRVGERRVVLTGGCFQNVYLTEVAVAALQAAGFDPFWHRDVPPNDGGIALGQAAWAAWSERRGEAPCA